MPEERSTAVQLSGKPTNPQEELGSGRTCVVCCTLKGVDTEMVEEVLEGVFMFCIKVEVADLILPMPSESFWPKERKVLERGGGGGGVEEEEEEEDMVGG